MFMSGNKKKKNYLLNHIKYSEYIPTNVDNYMSQNTSSES